MSADGFASVGWMPRRASSRPSPEQRNGKDFFRPLYEYPPGRQERRPYRAWWEHAKDRQSWEYVIAGVDDLREATGLEPELLLQFPGTEMVTRELPDGRREEALKVPREFVPSRR
jgi:hypothetical protein